jgi:hypothetical protein
MRNTSLKIKHTRTHTSAVHSILPKIQLGMFPGKIGGVTPVSLKTQYFLDRTYTCTFSTINTYNYTHKIIRQEIIRGSANTAYIHQQESFTMNKFLQLTVHAHTTQLHFASEKSLIHSSQQMIIELDKKLTLLPIPT